MNASPAPPGPRGHFLIGSLPEVRKDVLGFLTDCAREYGDVVHYRILNTAAYLINHPDLIEAILVQQYRNFVKGRIYRATRPVLGNGLLTSDGDTWQRQRLLVQPAFHHDRITAYADLAVTETDQLTSGWSNGETIDIYAEMKQLTLLVAAKSLFSAGISNETHVVENAMHVVLEQFSARMNTALLIPENFPTPGNLRLQKAVRHLESLVNKIIQDRRKGNEERSDLLSMLLNARDESGNPMSERELRDEILTLIIAGHDTTALALSWGFFLLAQNPAVEAALRNELQTELGGRLPSSKDLPCLRYTEMVVKESLRLYPTAWGISRVALNDFKIGGYNIPAGASIVMSQWVMHRDPRYFESPLEFKPQRWETEKVGLLPKFAYFPFGGGPRRCIGHAFALMEAVLVLATIIPKVRLTLVPDHPVEAVPSFTLYPRHGIRMVVTKPGD